MHEIDFNNKEHDATQKPVPAFGIMLSIRPACIIRGFRPRSRARATVAVATPNHAVARTGVYVNRMNERKRFFTKPCSAPPVGVVRLTKSKTLPSCRP